MKKRNYLILFTVILIAILLIGGIIWYSAREKKNSQDNTLDSLLEDATVETTFDVTSANPLEEAAPAINPIEKTNPFKDEYKNPFE